MWRVKLDPISLISVIAICWGNMASRKSSEPPTRGEQAQRGRCSLAEKGSGKGELGSRMRGCTDRALSCGATMALACSAGPRLPRGGSLLSRAGLSYLPCSGDLGLQVHVAE